MADTTNYGWTKPVDGGSAGVWGSLLNTVIDSIDSVVKGIDDRTEVTTIDLTGSGDFTAGELTLVRAGRLVTIAASVAPTHASNSSPTSAAGLIPADWRPILDVSSAYGVQVTKNIEVVKVAADGTFSLAFFNEALSALADVDRGSDLTISYVLPA